MMRVRMKMRKLMKRSNVVVLQRLPWSKEGSGQRAQSAVDWSLEVPTFVGPLLHGLTDYQRMRFRMRFVVHC